MKKLMRSICVVLSAIFVLAMATSCGNSYSYWNIEGKRAGNSDNLMQYYAELSFDVSDYAKVAEVWVNISALKPEKTNIKMNFKKYGSTSANKTFEVSKATIKKGNDGWINLYEGTDINASTVEITAVDTMHFNEVVFIDNEGKKLKIKFSKGGVKVGSSANIYTESQLKELSKEDPAYNEYPCYNLIDEQDKFPQELLNNSEDSSKN